MAIRKIFHTKDGIVRKTLTQAEIDNFAAAGDFESKREICKQELASATTTEQQLAAIKKFLGLI